MKKLISAKLAGNILIVILLMMIIFHILIMSGIIPHDIVWGGKINSDISLLKLEIIALLISFVFLFIIIVKVDYLKLPGFRKITNIALWIMFAYFLLNTLGNLASVALIEKLIFAPITIIMALLSFRLAIEK